MGGTKSYDIVNRSIKKYFQEMHTEHEQKSE